MHNLIQVFNVCILLGFKFNWDYQVYEEQYMFAYCLVYTFMGENQDYDAKGKF